MLMRFSKASNLWWRPLTNQKLARCAWQGACTMHAWGVHVQGACGGVHTMRMWGVHIQCMCGGACAMRMWGVHAQCMHGGCMCNACMGCMCNVCGGGACAMCAWECTCHACVGMHAQCTCGGCTRNACMGGACAMGETLNQSKTGKVYMARCMHNARVGGVHMQGACGGCICNAHVGVHIQCTCGGCTCVVRSTGGPILHESRVLPTIWRVIKVY